MVPLGAKVETHGDGHFAAANGVGAAGERAAVVGAVHLGCLVVASVVGVGSGLGVDGDGDGVGGGLGEAAGEEDGQEDAEEMHYGVWVVLWWWLGEWASE